MIEKEAIKKYGKESWIEMQKHLIGITIGVASNGESDYYEDDLELSFRASNGERIADWD